jgi:anti-sigma-K factor RskA
MTDMHISQEQADEYAIGSFPPEQERVIALHLADCDACRDLVREAERLAGRFALSAGARVRPSKKHKQRVLQAAGIRRPSMLQRFGTLARAAAGIAAVVVAVAAFTGMVSVRNKINGLEKANTELGTQINDALSQKVELAAITHRLSDAERSNFEQTQAARGDRELLLAMLSPKSDVADVYSPDDNTAAIGRLIWNSEQKRVWFVADNLSPRPNNQTYQIWVSSGGKYTSLGTFQPDDTGYARYVATVPQGMDSYDTAVVTIEEAGGSPQRTGPFVFSADLSPFKR